MTPRWIGSTPKASPTGTRSGGSTTIADQTSIRQPTASSRALSEQEHPARFDGPRGPLDGAAGPLDVDEIVREAERHAEDQEHATHQGAALRHHVDQAPPVAQPAVDHDLDREDIDRGERRGLYRR